MNNYTSKVNGFCDGIELKKGKDVKLTDEQAKALGNDVELKAVEKAPANKQMAPASTKSEPKNEPAKEPAKK